VKDSLAVPLRAKWGKSIGRASFERASEDQPGALGREPSKL
jgi:hypothetical protein